MPTSLSLDHALLVGAAGGALFVGIAYRLRTRTRRILANGLVVTALVYVAFAAVAGESPQWLAIELAGVAVYGSMALRGLRGSPWWLAAAWALHPLWDVALHYAGPGGAFAPTWWTIPCLSWDLVAAAYIGYRSIRDVHPAAATGLGLRRL